MIVKPQFAILMACLAGCAQMTANAVTKTDAPAEAAAGTCWAKSITPAIVETQTKQILVEPAATGPNGTQLWPAAYRTETKQVIVQERLESWFETPCPKEMTEDFIAALQRALNIRGFYEGPISGQMTDATNAAIRLYQHEIGIESGELSLEAARKLGLSTVPRKS